MFSIGAHPDYRLPFATVVVNQVTFPHMHRNVAGFTWQEPITLNIHLLAVRLDALRPASNDNNRRLNREGSVSPQPTIP